MKGAFAIIPVRDFSSAKSRLKDELSDEERTKLASALLSRVARATEVSQIERILVVASNPVEASSCLDGISKVTVVSEKKTHGGVNDAMKMGIDFAIRNNAKMIALYPSDLPLLTHTALDGAIELASKHAVVLIPSIKKDGTNFLAYNPNLQFDLHYDDDSFTKHTREAESRHLDLYVLDREEFSVDLDDLEDLNRSMTIYHAGSFQDLVTRIAETAV